MSGQGWSCSVSGPCGLEKGWNQRTFWALFQEVVTTFAPSVYPLNVVLCAPAGFLIQLASLSGEDRIVIPEMEVGRETGDCSGASSA